MRFSLQGLGVPLVFHVCGAPFSAEVGGGENGGDIDVGQIEGDMTLIRDDGQKGSGWIRTGTDGHHGEHLRNLEDAQLELIDLGGGLLALAHATSVAGRAGCLCDAKKSEQGLWVILGRTH